MQEEANRIKLTDRPVKPEPAGEELKNDMDRSLVDGGGNNAHNPTATESPVRSVTRTLGQWSETGSVLTHMRYNS